MTSKYMGELKARNWDMLRNLSTKKKPPQRNTSPQQRLAHLFGGPKMDHALEQDIIAKLRKNKPRVPHLFECDNVHNAGRRPQAHRTSKCTSDCSPSKPVKRPSFFVHEWGYWSEMGRYNTLCVCELKAIVRNKYLQMYRNRFACLLSLKWVFVGTQGSDGLSHLRSSAVRLALSPNYP